MCDVSYHYLKCSLRPCSDLTDRYHSRTFLLHNDLSTQSAKYCRTNCLHVFGTVQNLRNMASTLAKTNTFKNSQVSKKDGPTFSWTDKEVELLLENVKNFKVNMEAEGVDWESGRIKYDKIMEIVHENYPKTGGIEEFPYGEYTQELHKARITSKTKKIRSDYKKAVDSGKRSGGGRIIMTFYDLCQDI